MVIEVTVKTLDSNVFHFSVDDEVTVKDFKEFIATTVNVTWDKQRIIFCGKVLQDEKKLKDCNVNGKTVHLVQRLPPSTQSTSSTGTGTFIGGSSTSTIGEITPPQERGANNVYLGAFTVPHETLGQVQLEQVVQQVINSIGDLGRVTSREAPNRDGNVYMDIHRRLVVIRSLLRVGFNAIRALEGRPPETYPVQNQENQSRPSRRDNAGESQTTASASTASMSTESSIPKSGESGTETSVPEEPVQATATDTTEASAPPVETPEAESASESATGAEQNPPERSFSYLTVGQITTTRSTLAQVYNEVQYLQQCLGPFMQQYRSLLTSDTLTPDELNQPVNRSVSHRVGEVTHILAHINHLLSDLDIDTREPNNLIVRSTIGPSVQAFIPIRAEINVNSVTIPSTGGGGLNAAFGSLRNALSQHLGTAAESVAAAAERAAAAASNNNNVNNDNRRVTVVVQTATSQPPSGGSARAVPVNISVSELPAPGISTPPHPPAPPIPNVQGARPAFLVAIPGPQRTEISPDLRRAQQLLMGAANVAASRQFGFGTGQNRSREDTTASNTTTGTTHTPTTAGANMGFSRQPSENQQNTNPTRPSGTAQTTSTTSNTGSRPSTMMGDISREVVFDPYLVCDSAFAAGCIRDATHRGGRRGTSQRSVSASSATRRRDTSAGDRRPAAQTTRADGANVGVRSAAVDMLSVLLPGFSMHNPLPLATLINWESETGENDFLTELAATVTASLTTGDLMNWFFENNPRQFDALYTPLHGFLNRRLLLNQPYSEELLRSRVTELSAEWAAEVEVPMREANLNPNIDLNATTQKFLLERVYNLFKFILEYSPSDSNGQFGAHLMRHVNGIIIDGHALLSLCCLDGTESIELIFFNRVNQQERGAIIASMIAANMHSPTVRDTPELRAYIVQKATPSSTTTSPENASGDAGTSKQSCDEKSTDRSEANAVEAELMDIDDAAPERREQTIEPSISHQTALQALRAAVNEAATTESAPWLSAVPPGWGPIIQRDLGNQTSSQHPLSDAYICGVPSKRRRITKQANPSQLSNIPACIQQAIERAGVRPRTSLDALNQDLIDNSLSLHSALQMQIRDSLVRRLSSDSDFEKDKFPNASKLYKK